jgi:hypothetical protein
MRKKLLFTLPVLLLSLGVDASWKIGEAGQSCTIACEYAPEVECSSRNGDCQYYYGAYDYILCDGFAIRCPL